MISKGLSPSGSLGKVAPKLNVLFKQNHMPKGKELWCHHRQTLLFPRNVLQAKCLVSFIVESISARNTQPIGKHSGLFLGKWKSGSCWADYKVDYLPCTDVLPERCPLGRALPSPSNCCKTWNSVQLPPTQQANYTDFGLQWKKAGGYCKGAY